MSNPKHYTAKDIERYHNGGMTAAEMHQLEKAALDDPMLADALEGYRFSKNPVAELAGLQSRLQQRISEEKKEQRIIFMQPWMRVAALLLFMAGAGWLVVQTFSTRENDLATSTPALNKEERMTESAAADSSATVLQQQPTAFSIDSNARDVASQNSVQSRRISPAPQAKTSTPLTVMKESTTAKKNEAKMDREVVDAAQAAPQNEVATLKATAPPAVRMQEMDSTTNSMAMRRKRAGIQEGRALEGREASVALDSLAQPAQGWKAFEEYIAKNRKPVLPLNKKQSTENNVELAFDINPQGRPVNIVVTQSGNQVYNDEAIRLLKEGPDWKGKNGKVKILFPN
jgi:hypothetical protein